MSNTAHYVELIEAYLSQSLPEKERILFEQALTQDPALHQEFLFQKELQEGIQEYRRSELKGRLDQINPQTGWYPWGQAGLLKIGAAITGLALIGSVFYFWPADTEYPAFPNLANIDLIDQEAIADLQPAPAEVEIIEETMTIPVTPQPEGKPAADKTITTANEEPAPVKEDAAEEKVPVTEVIKPNIVADFDETDPNTELSEPGGSPASVESEKIGEINTVEVTTMEDKKYDFHYQFYNNKLFLFGEFHKVPYEILELNHLSGKTHYLYYKGTYYMISENVQEVAPLVPIEDEQLIKDLNIIRRNKSLD